MKKILTTILAIMLMTSMILCTSCGSDEPKQLEAVTITTANIADTLLDAGKYEVKISNISTDWSFGDTDKTYTLIDLEVENKSKENVTIEMVDAAFDGVLVEATSDADAVAKETTAIEISVCTSDLKSKKLGTFTCTLQVQEEEEYTVLYEVPVTIEADVFAVK